MPAVTPRADKGEGEGRISQAQTLSPALALVVLLAVALPLIPADIASPRWHGLKTLAFEVGAAVVLALLPWSGRARVFRLDTLRRPGAPLSLAALLLWATLSGLLSPDEGFAVHGWWLDCGGAVIACAVAQGLRARDDYRFLSDGLTAAGLVVSGATFALYLRARMTVAEGTYHDHMLLGAVLLLLLPMALAAACAPVSQTRRTAALAALVLCSLALLLSQTRSAWVGAVISLLTFGGLLLFTGRTAPQRQEDSGSRRRGRVQALVYGLLVLCALGLFLLTAQQNVLLAGRARSLTTALQDKGGSVEWRFSTWRGALRMVAQKPLQGWGVGGYPLHQQPFTHTGEPPSVVARAGPRIWDEAHDTYLQVAAELGVPGLLLWLLVLGGALTGGVQALRRLPPAGLRQRLLMGALAGLAGQSVDALANPGWQFGEVALYFWIALGIVLGAAAPQPADDGPGCGTGGGPPHAFPRSRPLWLTAAAVVAVWVVYETTHYARLLPTPHL